jgi:Ca2+-transporting ATPase
MDGLTTTIARARLAELGRNELPAPDHRTALRLIGSVLREPMMLLLLLATGLYTAFGDLTEAAALGGSVVAIAVITVVQERRTERALDALRDLARPSAHVLRDGEWRTLDAGEIVPGDLVHVGEGERVPADALLRSGTPLTVDESLLTGESVPVVRTPDETTALARPGQEGNSLFSGTLVASGNAVAEVVRTGAETEVGRIGVALGTIELARAPLHREVIRVVRRVAVIAVSVCAVLAAIHLIAGHGWLAAGLAGITLAMALVPEELPLVLTVFLTLGARRIAKHRVLARRAAAIETLGAMTVLCVDKTGTLTKNRMTIRRIWTERPYDVSGEPLPEDVHEAIEYGLLACPQQTTDAMDHAFATLAGERLANTEHVHPRWRWLREYPLSPGLLAVTHVWQGDDDRVVVATKGAPEAIIDLCHLDAQDAATWRRRSEQMAAEGLRVLGVAHALHARDAIPDHPHDYAFELVGLVGLVDPLREGIAETIATCRAAGVRIIMITGDHPTTARAIARQAGLETDEVLAGSELELLDDTTLRDRLAHVEVIARAAPAHKLRIIQALRAAGEVVGMTGDGVNDAPALRAADVGVAMGRGTDVAREAAGLVLLDDALHAIVPAIRIGRTIYENLRKVAGYLFAVHIPIALLALLPPLLGWPLLLTPFHLALLELVIDPTCSIVFEQEPPTPDTMQRRPRGRGEHLFETKQVAFSIVLGLAAFAGPFTVVAFAHHAGLADGVMRALGFTSLVAADLALVIASRGRHGRERNPATPWMVLAVAVVVGLGVAIPGLRTLLTFELPAMWQLAAAASTGVLPVLALALLDPLGRTRALAGRLQSGES